jgi:FADH2-dependent halogenase
LSQLPHDYEAAVIGGGPAGASAAATLARLGRRVVLFERDRFPRFHIGESLLAASNEAFEKLGCREKVEAAGFTRKWGASFGPADGSAESYADFSVSGEIPFPQTWQVPRERFDKLLLRHAEESGAEVYQEHRVMDAVFDAEGVTLDVAGPQTRRTVRVQAVIDASGRLGLLARKLRLRVEEPKLANIAVFAHYSGVPRPAGRRAGDIRIIGRDDLGWFWFIPISEELMSVGVVLQRRVFDTWPRMPHEEILQRAIADTPAASALMRDAKREWPVRVEKDFSYCVRAYAGDRWLLAGDAGSFLDPVFSTGVTIALESGIEAGRALGAALACGDLSAPAFARFERVQRLRYRMFRRFVVNFYTPYFRDLFFQPGGGARLFDAVVTAVAGRWRPSFRRRLLIHLFFFLVWLQKWVPVAPRLARRERVEPRSSALPSEALTPLTPLSQRERGEQEGDLQRLSPSSPSGRGGPGR